MNRLHRLPLLAAGLAVVAVTLAVFAGSLSAGFVMWDDPLTIYDNPALGDLTLDRLAWALTDTATTMRWIPITLTSLLVTHTLHGLDPFGYHLHNWLIHGAAALAAFLVLRELLGRASLRRGGGGREDGWVLASAAAGALAWSLHPLRTEVEAWSNSRGHALAGLFVFLSLLAYLRAHREDAPAPHPWRGVAGSAALFLLALTSHPIAVGAAPLFVLLDVHLGRIGGAAGWWSPAARRALLEKLPYAAVTALVLGVTLAVRTFHSGRWPAPVPLSDWGVFPRAVQAGYAWIHYATVTLWPVGLQPAPLELFDFDPWSAPYLGRAALVVAITAAAALAWRRWPLALLLWGAHLLMLVPALGLTEHPMFACDRYTYQAGLVPAAAVGALVLWQGRTQARRRAAGAGAAALLTALGALTVGQVSTWSNSGTLFNHMIPLMGDHPYRANVYFYLGVYEHDHGRHAAAVAALQQAATLRPIDGAIRAYLGDSLLGIGRAEEAVPHLDLALRFQPQNVELRCRLAAAYVALRRPEEARREATLAAGLSPGAPCAVELLRRFERPAAR